jgi:hypothetical protein
MKKPNDKQLIASIPIPYNTRISFLSEKIRIMVDVRLKKSDSIQEIERFFLKVFVSPGILESGAVLY